MKSSLFKILSISLLLVGCEKVSNICSINECRFLKMENYDSCLKHYTESKTTTINTYSCYGKRTTSIQCGGTTQKGYRCKNRTLSCNGKCYLHGGN